LFVVTSINCSCSTEDEGSNCNDTGDCIPDGLSAIGLLSLTFESLETGEDVFLNETFNLNEFQIRDANTAEEVEFSFGNFVDLNENGIVDNGEFVGNSDQLRIRLPFNPEINDFMYEIVLSENQIISLDFTAVIVEEDDIDITNISFGDTLFETISTGFYNILVN